MDIFILNIKFLCLILWLEEVTPMTMMIPTAMTHDGQSMIVSGSVVDKPSEPKITSQSIEFGGCPIWQANRQTNVHSKVFFVKIVLLKLRLNAH